MGGLGGCKTVEEWKQAIPSCPIEAAIKALFIDFIEQGYVPDEFLLAMLALWSEMVISYLLPST